MDKMTKQKEEAKYPELLNRVLRNRHCASVGWKILYCLSLLLMKAQTSDYGTSVRKYTEHPVLLTGSSTSRKCRSSDAILWVFPNATTKDRKEIIKTIVGKGRGVKEYSVIIPIRTNQVQTTSQRLPGEFMDPKRALGGCKTHDPLGKKKIPMH